MEDLQDMLDALREEGWRVAVHNDYTLNGKDCTFWLFTHPCGRYVKAEAFTDSLAVRKVMIEVASIKIDIEGR